MIFRILMLFFIIVAVPSVAITGQSQNEAFAQLSSALQKYVQDGLVDYPGIAKDKDFADFLKWLATAEPDLLPSQYTTYHRKYGFDVTNLTC